MKKFAVLASLGFALSAFATVVPKGTDVRLSFDDGLNSKTSRVGDKVNFHVVEDVLVGGQVVITKGTLASGTVTKVERGRRFGVNARVQIRLDPVAGADGTMIPIATREKGKRTGSATDKAAIATGAGVLMLGPVGLGIGYFMTGKEVRVKSGDTLSTEVLTNTEVKSSTAPGGIQNAGQGASGS